MKKKLFFNRAKLFAFAGMLGLLAPALNATKWDYLQAENIIDIVAPSYGNASNLEKVEENIRALGFTARIPSDLLSPQPPFDDSNTRDYKIDRWNNAFSAPDSKAVWAVRGGRGGSDIFTPGTDVFKKENYKAKLFIGYSDVTTHHLYINKILGWPSLHWLVLAYNQDANPVVNAHTPLKWIVPILKGDVQELIYHITPLNTAAKQNQIIEDTVIIGGNASLIQRNIGTDLQPDTRNKILFLEDVHEESARLLEVMIQFKRVGLLNDLKALLLGNFSLPEGEIETERFAHLINWLSKEMGGNTPIFQSAEFGHGPINRPLFFNTPTRIESNADQATLKIKTNNE